MRESLNRLDSTFANDARHQRPADEPENKSGMVARSQYELGSSSLDQREKVLSWLNQNVPEKRLQHIIRVEEMAVKLAQHHQLDVERAAQAGLMHDLAKCFKPKQLLQLASENGLEIDPVFAANPHLLHADVGAIVARDEFGIEDVPVLEAIANHTLGSPGMSALSCVVYLADTLEPGRGDTSDLQSLRELCWHNLHQAVWFTSEYTLKYLFESRNLIHPRALMTRNWAMQMALSPQELP